MSILWDYLMPVDKKHEEFCHRELLKVTTTSYHLIRRRIASSRCFPCEEIAQACQRALHDKGKYALQYSSTEGYIPLREWINNFSGGTEICTTAENILITSGSQQALI